MQRAFAVVFLLGVFLSVPLRAQDRAAISGTVKDPSGAVVPAASVELDSQATGFHRATATNAEGSTKSFL